MSPIAWIVLILVAVWLLTMLVLGLRYAVDARARAVAAEEPPGPRSHAEASRHQRG